MRARGKIAAWPTLLALCQVGGKTLSYLPGVARAPGFKLHGVGWQVIRQVPGTLQLLIQPLRASVISACQQGFVTLLQAGCGQ